jgi:(p)ppGpp synthase/HD superfamily hydrolase
MNEKLRLHPSADSDPSQIKPVLCTEESFRADLETFDLWTAKVDLAFRQATASHRFKIRDSGQPYLEEHIFPVSHDILDYLRAKGEPPFIQERGVIVALLHDTVEDDKDFDLNDCESKFGLEISRLVYPLTKYGLNRDIYIKKIENAPMMVQAIKIFDRINNLRCSISLAQPMNALPKDVLKLERYAYESLIAYLPIASLIIDDKLYDTLNDLIITAQGVLEGKANIYEQ